MASRQENWASGAREERESSSEYNSINQTKSTEPLHKQNAMYFLRRKKSAGGEGGPSKGTMTFNQLDCNLTKKAQKNKKTKNVHM